MNKERLIIKNFGPIQSVDLELGKMNVLIGDNATGKSTIAKVLSVCRYFSYIVDCEFDIGLNNSFDEGLGYWGILDYLKTDTFIEYHCNEYKLHVTYEIKDWDFETNENGDVIGKGTPIYAGTKVSINWKSEKFENLLHKLESMQPWNSNKNQPDNELDWFNWKPSSNFFEIEVKQVMENPFYFPTERGLQSVFSLGRGKSLNDSLYNQLADLHNISTFFSKPTSLNLFGVSYQNSEGKGYIKKEDNVEMYPLQNSASGYQTVIPIILVLKYYAEKEKRLARTYIIEEPEINLFPTNQKKLIEYFVESINKYGNQFILPTHSPYILSALNDLLLAYKRGQQFPDKVINLGYKKDIWLNPDDLSVYQLHENDENGTTSENILSEDTRLIKRNIIDDFSDELDDNFDNLLDVE